MGAREKLNSIEIRELKKETKRVLSSNPSLSATTIQYRAVNDLNTITYGFFNSTQIALVTERVTEIPI